MDYEEFEDFINSLKNFKNKFSFRENGFNIDYFSNSDEESDYSFWIAPYIVVQDSYNYTYNYQHDKNYYAEVSDIETDEFKSWINKIVDKLKNSQVKKIVSNNAGDLSIYWENDYILNVLLNDLEESFLYFYDYINLKSYHFSLSKIEIRELASRNSHRLERELMQILNFKGYDKNIIDKIKKEVIEINNERLNNLLISIYHEKSTDLSSLAYIKEGKESQDLYQKLFNKYQEIIDINPKSSDTYFSWGYNLVLFAEKVELEQAFPLYQEAIQKYQKVIEIEADSDAAFNNIGNIFADLAQLEENDKEVEFLYNKAFENYKKAIEINPNKYKSFYNWAMFLGDLAEFKAQNSSFFAEEKEAESLYKQAFKKYEKALEIKPEDYNSLYNWANNLSNFASIKEGKKSESLYNEAFKKYEKASIIKPKSYKVFFSWAYNLGDLAYDSLKNTNKAESLYKQAFEKYQKAINIKPNSLETLKSWGFDLACFANTQKEKISNKLYQEAFKKLKKAIELGDSHYYLSSVYAIKGEKENALKHLEITLKNNDETSEFVKNDEDWKDYLEDKDFIDLLKKY